MDAKYYAITIVTIVLVFYGAILIHLYKKIAEIDLGYHSKKEIDGVKVTVYDSSIELSSNATKE